MQGLILAAGMGKRLKDLTQNNTKCMVKVNGVSLIQRVLNQLDRYNLSRIVIVVGYEGQKLIDHVATLNVKTPIIYVFNNIYNITNNIYSLYLAKEHLLSEDTILLESDLIFEDSVLDQLFNDPTPSLALVDKYQSWMDGTCVKVDEEDNIIDFIPGKKFDYGDVLSYYKTVNVYKFSKDFSATHYVPFLEAYVKALGNNEYYEQVLRIITMLDKPDIKAKRLSGQAWYEIDDIQDLDIAESMFASTDDDKLDKLSCRYGGYWRYSSLKDFCYLVNPYYPPKQLISEMKASFERLLTEYPSGMRVNSLLAGKNFGINQKFITVGNGAAELIKSLMENLGGNVGFIRPTFEEYSNRYPIDKSIYYNVNSSDFSYSADDIINYFKDYQISALVLINPDNPSGNLIKKQGVIKLIEFLKSKNAKLILDESFIDFAQEEGNSLLSNQDLIKYDNLIVIKSISKSFGVPGIRLGILASSDKQLISFIKKDVGIWNINSFGEFYLQVAEKYKKDYALALDKFKLARKYLTEQLLKIKNLTAFPSDANYLMIELDSKYTSRELAKILLSKYDVLIKDLSPKINNGKQYIRVAVKSEQDNHSLIKALNECYNN